MTPYILYRSYESCTLLNALWFNGIMRWHRDNHIIFLFRYFLNIKGYFKEYCFKKVHLYNRFRIFVLLQESQKSTYCFFSKISRTNQKGVLVEYRMVIYQNTRIFFGSLSKYFWYLTSSQIIGAGLQSPESIVAEYFFIFYIIHLIINIGLWSVFDHGDHRLVTESILSQCKT